MNLFIYLFFFFFEGDHQTSPEVQNRGISCPTNESFQWLNLCKELQADNSSAESAKKVVICRWTTTTSVLTIQQILFRHQVNKKVCFRKYVPLGDFLL